MQGWKAVKYIRDHGGDWIVEIQNKAWRFFQ